MKILFLFAVTITALLIPRNVFASSLVINEFMANPSSGYDWIELYNPTASSIDLTNWMLVDSTSTMKTLSGTIAAGAFTTFDVSTRLNKTSDSIYLKDPTNTIDSYSYTTEPSTDVSIGRSPDGGSWTTLSSSSKGSSNGGSSPSPSPSPSPSSSTSSYFTISNVPLEINSTQNFTVNVNLNLPNNQNTDYYLKGAFKKVGVTRYFGMTKVGSSWINYGSDLSNQLKITTNSSGQWSGNIEVQPDVLDNDYDGTGDYIFKVARYTISGGLSWTSEDNIKINAKEVVSSDEVINLSNLAQKSQDKVLGEEKKANDIPDEVYSLENYRKSATLSSSPSASPAIKIKSDNQNFIVLLLGGIFLGSGIGFAVYIFLKNRV